MQTELLFRILSQIRPLPAGVRRAVETCLHEENYSCDKILVRNNAVMFKIWFMVEGFAHAYRERDHKEETLWFAGKGEFFTADAACLIFTVQSGTDVVGVIVFLLIRKRNSLRSKTREILHEGRINWVTTNVTRRGFL